MWWPGMRMELIQHKTTLPSLAQLNSVHLCFIGLPLSRLLMCAARRSGFKAKAGWWKTFKKPSQTMQDLKSWMSCTSFIWSHFLTSEDWGVHFRPCCFVAALYSHCIHCVLTTSHFTGFHGAAFPPPLLHHALSPLPLLASHLGEFNLVSVLNEAQQELGREGSGHYLSEVKLAPRPAVVKGAVKSRRLHFIRRKFPRSNHLFSPKSLWWVTSPQVYRSGESK